MMFLSSSKNILVVRSARLRRGRCAAHAPLRCVHLPGASKSLRFRLLLHGSLLLYVFILSHCG